MHTDPASGIRQTPTEASFEASPDLFAAHGPPEHLRSDNGPEFVARNVREWLRRIGMKTLYIEPGSQTGRTATARA